MDIQKIQDEKAQEDIGIELPIVRRDGEPDLASDGTQTTFTVVGRNSARVKKVIDRQARQNARRRSDLKPDEVYEQRVERAAAALTGWHGVEDNGQPVILSPDSARLVLADPHYLEQVEDGMVNHGRFFKTASANS